MIMKNSSKYPIVILILFYLGVTLYLHTKSTMMNTQQVLGYEPYKAFSIEVDHEEWHGQLEPGRYTKSGILIIKQNGN